MTALRRILGVEIDEVSFREKLVSTAGGIVSILAILAVSHQALDLDGAAMVVASMGASAVLLFAVPHGALSQPWPLAVGHLASAAIGVTCARFVPSMEVAAALAVGLSIGLMHQLGSIHPPGGATALTAVVGGPAVHDLGYGFVARPVLLNVVVILAVAVAFNLPFPWRRYPAGLVHLAGDEEPTEASHAEVVAALRSLDSFIDVTEDDLRRLVRLLQRPS